MIYKSKRSRTITDTIKIMGFGQLFDHYKMNQATTVKLWPLCEIRRGGYRNG